MVRSEISPGGHRSCYAGVRWAGSDSPSGFPGASAKRKLKTNSRLLAPSAPPLLALAPLPDNLSPDALPKTVSGKPITSLFVPHQERPLGEIF